MQKIAYFHESEALKISQINSGVAIHWTNCRVTIAGGRGFEIYTNNKIANVMECSGYIATTELTKGNKLWGGWESVASVYDITTGHRISSFGALHCIGGNSYSYDLKNGAVSAVKNADSVNLTPSFIYPFFIDRDHRCWAFVEKMGVSSLRENGIAIYSQNGAVEKFMRITISGALKSLVPITAYACDGDMFILFTSRDYSGYSTAIVRASVCRSELISSALINMQIGGFRNLTPCLGANSSVDATMGDDGVAQFIIESDGPKIFGGGKCNIRI